MAVKPEHLSKGRKHGQKMLQYSEPDTLTMHASILLRLPEAQAHIREQAAFKDVAKHLESQVGRPYRSLKAKLNKLLVPDCSPHSTHSLGEPSLLQVPFFRDAVIQALKGEQAARGCCKSSSDSLADLDTRDSASDSLGKRTPINGDSSPLAMLYPTKTSAGRRTFEFLEPVFEADHFEGPELDFSFGHESCLDREPRADFDALFDADHFNRLVPQLRHVTEDLDDCDLVRNLNTLSIETYSFGEEQFLAEPALDRLSRLTEHDACSAESFP